jgi:hypothetical protein
MTQRSLSVARFATGFARLSLGAAFLSGIASRFGLWGKDVGYGDFDHFVQYTAEVNAFMPALTIPFLAWAATVAELVLGPRSSGFGLLGGAGQCIPAVPVGTAMTISQGLQSPRLFRLLWPRPRCCRPEPVASTAVPSRHPKTIREPAAAHRSWSHLGSIVLFIAEGLQDP